MSYFFHLKAFVSITVKNQKFWDENIVYNYYDLQVLVCYNTQFGCIKSSSNVVESKLVCDASMQFIKTTKKINM